MRWLAAAPITGIAITFLSGYEGFLVPQAMQVSGADLVSVGNNVTVASDNRLVWSPDGTRVAFSDGSDIWVVSQFSATNLTNTPADGDTWPTWSPDGTRIAFVSARDGNPNYRWANGLIRT
jgi:Tol biopolymer transport system component